MTRLQINITFLAFAVLFASFAQSRVIVETVEETYYPPSQVSEVTTYETTTATKEVSGKDFAVFVLAMGGAVIVVGGIVLISASSDGASTPRSRSSGWGDGGHRSRSSSNNETAKLVTTGAAAGLGGFMLGTALAGAEGPDTKVTTVKRTTKTTSPQQTPVVKRFTRRTTVIDD